MGGSSLAPEVLRRAFAVESFHVLDTTHPAAIRRLESGLDLERTLFIASSKSGSTIETRSHLEYFWERTGGRGAQFAAITDPGSELEQLAQERGFRATFPGEPEIGGRYSALSLFGIVPASLMGVALERFLERAAEMMEALRLAGGESGPRARPAARRGLAVRARQGLHRLASVGLRTLGRAAARRIDRQAGQGARARRPASRRTGPDRQRGEVRLPDPYELGQEWLRWEFATAVAGHVLGINPFDQPDVQAAKDKTNEVLAAGEPDVAPRGSLDELLARGERGRLRLHPGVHRPGPRRRAGSPRRQGARDRLRRHERPRPALPALDGAAAQGWAEHRSLHPGRRRDGRGAGDPGSRLRLRPPDSLAGRRRPRGARGAGQACRANPTGGDLDATRHGRPRPDGLRDDEAARGARARGQDLRPERASRRRRRSARSRSSSSAAARVDDGAVRRRSPRTRSRSCSASSSPATRSSTAATRTSATRSAATRRRASGRSRSPTSASRAASGASRSASA